MKIRPGISRVVGFVFLSAMTSAPALGQEVQSSPFHRMQDGNGRIIPCECWIGGQLVKLGTTACMNTPNGRQMSRCSLVENVTSWVPTGESCQVSGLDRQHSLVLRQASSSKFGITVTVHSMRSAGRGVRGAQGG
jgi:hypothetical protein